VLDLKWSEFRTTVAQAKLGVLVDDWVRQIESWLDRLWRSVAIAE